LKSKQITSPPFRVSWPPIRLPHVSGVHTFSWQKLGAYNPTCRPPDVLMVGFNRREWQARSGDSSGHVWQHSQLPVPQNTRVRRRLDWTSRDSTRQNSSGSVALQ